MANKDRNKYNAYMRKYVLKRYHKRRKSAISHLGGRCKSCGSESDLEIDHKDPDKKEFSVSRLWSIRKKKFWEEIEKCQLLCSRCHQEKTLKDLGRKSAKKIHGTLSSYRYCKCSLCKKAKSDYNKKYKAKKEEEGQ